MATEDNQGKSKWAAMPRKQKIIGAGIVVIFIVVIWQIMGLFGGEKSAPTVTPVDKTKASTLATTAQSPQPNAPTSTPAVQQVDQTKLAASTTDSEIANLQRDSQDKYLKSLNTLQLLRIQKDIAETNQAIASSELAKVTAEKGISDILTRPSPNAQPANFAPTPSRTAEVATTTTVSVPAQQPVGSGYVLMSVFMSSGNWQAVIGFQGKMYTVSKGDVLPMDGAMVTSIGKDSIVLEKDGQRKVLNLVPPL